MFAVSRPQRAIIRANRGFSLFEILIVVAIIALSSAAVVVSLNALTGRRLNSEMEQMTFWFEAVAETAVLQASVLGVRSNQRGFDVVAYYDNRWFPLNDIESFSLSGEFEWQIETEEQIDFGVEIDDRDEDREPFIAFLPSGQAIPEGQVNLATETGEPPAVIRWDRNADFEFLSGGDQ